jgi:DNA ligase-1
MLAADGFNSPLQDERYAYEPKLDGIRAVLSIDPIVDGTCSVNLLSRNGCDKSRSFPEIVSAAHAVGRWLRHGITFDGEIVALDETSRPARLPALRRRIHRTAESTPDLPRVAFYVFDLLRVNGHDVRTFSLLLRRSALEHYWPWATAEEDLIRLVRQDVGDGRALWHEVVASGGEGLMVKRIDAEYSSGVRSSAWLKRKLVADPGPARLGA